jgi:hypothetical protein
VSNPEQIATDAGIEQQLDETRHDQVAEPVEIETEMLSKVAGGPDGSVVGYG